MIITRFLVFYISQGLKLRSTQTIDLFYTVNDSFSFSFWFTFTQLTDLRSLKKAMSLS